MIAEIFFLVLESELSISPEKSILRELILQIVKMVIAEILKRGSLACLKLRYHFQKNTYIPAL